MSGGNYRWLGVGMVALLSAACKDDRHQAQWWQGEQERLELSQNLKLKQFRFEQSGSQAWVELEPLLAAHREGEQRLGSLKQKRADLEHELETLREARTTVHAEFIQSRRRSAIGTSFEEFSSSEGRIFQNARIVAIDDAGVTIRHDDGSARLRFDDLDVHQRELFGLEQSSAQAAINEEARQALAYESWVDGQLAVVEEKEARAAEVAQREEDAARRARELAASRHLIAAANRPLAQPASSFGNRYSAYYPSNYTTLRPTRTHYRYVYYHQTPSYCQQSYGYNPYRRISQSLPRPVVCPPANVDRSQSFSNTTLPYIP